MARLPSKGRKKIDQLKRIENERERAVTLSKRRNGLFKKANEIATLCRVQIAIILFSISGKPLSFGSPNVQSVVNNFLNSNQVGEQSDDFITRLVDFSHESKLQDCNKEFNQVNEQLTNEKKRGQMLDASYTKRSVGGKTDELQRNEALTLDAACGPSSSNDEYEADLSIIGMPKDYLKL